MMRVCVHSGRDMVVVVLLVYMTLKVMVAVMAVVMVVEVWRVVVVGEGSDGGSDGGSHGDGCGDGADDQGVFQQDISFFLHLSVRSSSDWTR